MRITLKTFRVVFLAALLAASLVLLPVANPAYAQSLVRKDFTTLSPLEIFDLKQGIEVMQSRPADDPTSWLYQANIHGCPDDSCLNPAPIVQATCQHGSFFFLSWHRMYLYYFEKILGAASGNPNFALPYWNYTYPSPDNRKLPAAFRDHDSSNPLYVQERNLDVNERKPLPCTAVDPGSALKATKFIGIVSDSGFGGGYIPEPMHFAGRTGKLERTPHNVVHGLVGGLMGDVDLAARDPIFWLHHANIDRLWDIWIREGNSNPSDFDNLEDRTWLETEFTFYDIDLGDFVTLTGAEVVDTAVQLGYLYDSYETAQDFANNPDYVEECGDTTRRILTNFRKEERNRQSLLSSTLVTDTLSGSPKVFSRPFSSKPPFFNQRRSNVEPKFTLSSATSEFLTLEGVEYDPEQNLFYEVYLNLPTPLPANLNPYYAGNIALFAFPQGGDYTLNISDTVRDLIARGELTNPDDISVTFVPAALQGQTVFDDPSSIRFENLRITAQ